MLNKAVKGSGKSGCSSVSVSDDAVSVSLFSRLVSTAAPGSTSCTSQMLSSVKSDDRGTEEEEEEGIYSFKNLI